MKIFTKTLSRFGLTADNGTKVDETADQTSSDISFNDFPFDQKLQQIIADEKYLIPTPIQARAIPIVLEGRDIIACAQTGTGKTAAFALPAIHRILTDMKNEKQRSYHPKVLVLVPTRELALQVQETFAIFGHALGINSVAIIGGVSIGTQFQAIRRRSPQIIVATPGRLLDILNQGGINLTSVTTLILDEADRMLDMGFIPDTKRIVKTLPVERQTMLFSATISDEVRSLSKQLMTNPAFVSVAPTRASAEGIEQMVYPVSQENKRLLLSHLLLNEEMNRVIIFTRTKFSASKLSDYLTREGTRAKVIHSGKSQAARQVVWEHFRSGRLRVLVATDLASRGIDVEGISHVINYDMPDCAETYIHRIGRTGRANRTGIALSFCSPDQRRLLIAVERHLGKNLPVCKDQAYLSYKPQPVSQDRGGFIKTRDEGSEEGSGFSSRRSDDQRGERRSFRDAGPERRYSSRPSEGTENRTPFASDEDSRTPFQIGRRKSRGSSNTKRNESPQGRRQPQWH